MATVTTTATATVPLVETAIVQMTVSTIVWYYMGSSDSGSDCGRNM